MFSVMLLAVISTEHEAVKIKADNYDWLVYVGCDWTVEMEITSAIRNKLICMYFMILI